MRLRIADIVFSEALPVRNVESRFQRWQSSHAFLGCCPRLISRAFWRSRQFHLAPTSPFGSSLQRSGEPLTYSGAHGTRVSSFSANRAIQG